jgi:SAM-dependent methyltransferase
MRAIDLIMENPSIYRLWQSPYAELKFAPIIAHNDLSRVRRVLDVACGPGTNTHHFANADYLGIDLNEGCIEYARRHYKRNFLLADVTKYRVAPGERFDFILLNSFIHHVDTPNTVRILEHLRTLLTHDGHVHILDHVLPEHPSFARFLARIDRGKYPRPMKEWLEMVTGVFETVVLEPYRLTALGATLWNQVYFKGKVKPE